MKVYNLALLTQATRKLYYEAYKQYNTYAPYDMEWNYKDSNEYEEYRVAQELFVEYVNDIIQRIRVGFEIMGLPGTLSDFSTVCKSITANYYGHETWQGTDAYGSLSLGKLNLFISILEEINIAPEEVDKGVDAYQLLLQLLENTAWILRCFKATPKTEAEVYKPVGVVLQSVFSDFNNQPVLQKTLKAYRPEFGFSRLRAVVEYKFVDSAADAKSVVDQLATDIRGYVDPNYDKFVAVVYMTDLHVNPEAIKAHVVDLCFPKSWTLLVVSGPGGRATAPRERKGVKRPGRIAKKVD